jgi:hypothetical protein
VERKRIFAMEIPDNVIADSAKYEDQDALGSTKSWEVYNYIQKKGIMPEFEECGMSYNDLAVFVVRMGTEKKNVTVPKVIELDLF